MESLNVDDQYFEILRQLLRHGKYKPNRTGVGAYGITFASIRCPSVRQFFPILTTKRIHFKSVAEELLWFLRGSTNAQELEDKGVNIWREWYRPFPLERDVVLIDKKIKPYVPYNGDFSLEGYYSRQEKLQKTWLHMMGRCYDTSHHRYNLYGACGVSVCERWHNFSNFVDDVKSLPHWRYKEKNWDLFELDKDYYGSNQYGPDTSVWLHTAENCYYTKATKPISIKKDDGEMVFLNISHAARGINTSARNLHRWLKNGTPSVYKRGNKQYLGWKFDYFASDKLVRLALIGERDMGPIYGAQWKNFGGVDQIANVQESLKADPFSRRHIVSAWNPPEIPKMALPPCHYAFQFVVQPDYRGIPATLDCIVHCRSQDFFLGTPFNIASYALLNCLMAHTVGLEAGDLIWTGGDVHLYENHIEAAREQFMRSPYPLPTLDIHCAPKNVWEYTFDDFSLVNYRHHPAIKAPVAV